MLYTALLSAEMLMAYKIIAIGHLTTSAALPLISIIYFLANVITEVYGYQIARQIIWSSLICLLISSSICCLENKIRTPHLYATYGEAYNIIIPKLFRSYFANSFSLIIGSFVNVYIISRWKVLLLGKFFWLRCLGASAIGESVYTILVIYIVNVGIVPSSTLIEMMVVSYTFKLSFDLLAIWPASLLALFLKNKEGFDRYDYQTNFNPFKLHVENSYDDKISKLAT